jgi:hypothetical protein
MITYVDNKSTFADVLSDYNFVLLTTLIDNTIFYESRKHAYKIIQRRIKL